jgi:hypothetical protein
MSNVVSKENLISISEAAPICASAEISDVNRMKLRDLADFLGWEVDDKMTARELCGLLNLHQDSRAAKESATTIQQATKDVKAILFIDFDQTITQGHMSKLTGQKVANIYDKKDIDDALNKHMPKIFTNKEYIAQLQQFWTELHNIKGLKVQILSKGLEHMIEAVLENIGLTPKPEIVGWRQLFGLYQGKKDKYIQEKLKQKPVPFVFFVDDTQTERKDVEALKQKNPETEFVICCDEWNVKPGVKELTGLTASIIDKILKTIRDKLGPEPTPPIVEAIATLPTAETSTATTSAESSPPTTPAIVPASSQGAAKRRRIGIDDSSDTDDKDN